MESLEGRQMMAVSVVMEAGGFLSIYGDNDANQVIVTERGSLPEMVQVESDAGTHLFPKASVNCIAFFGEGGRDVFSNYTSKPSWAWGGPGRDTLRGGSATDLLFGEGDNDYLYGNAGADRLYGGADNDQLYGGADDDILRGDGGNDWLFGQGGDDTLRGLTGDDVYFFDTASSVEVDTLIEASGSTGGIDSLNFILLAPGDQAEVDLNSNTIATTTRRTVTTSTPDRFEDVFGSFGDDYIIGNSLNNHLRGISGDDTLEGRAGDDILEGGNGDDILWGGEDSDELWGGNNDDRLIGGSGVDFLHGGNGNDGLFGGMEIGVTDTLEGGGGDDRFLRHARKSRAYGRDRDASPVTLVDCGANDVVMKFYHEDYNSGRDELPWTEQEIAVIDEAFKRLYDMAGTTLILKDPNAGSSPGDRPLRFYKADTGRSWDGLHNPSSYGDEIYIVDWNETNADRNHDAMAIVTHEIAHGWDDPWEADHHPAYSGSWDYWSDFRSLSWDSENISVDDLEAELLANPARVTDYTRPYGANCVNDDWATCWEVALGYLPVWGTPSANLNQKLAVVDDFFARFV